MWCGRETLLPLIADLECSFAVLQLSCTHCVALLRTLFFCSTVGGAHRAAPSWRSTATCCKRRCCSAVPWHGTTHGRPAPNFGLLRKGLLDCHSSTRALGRALPVAIGTHVPWPRRRCGRIPFAAARQTLSQGDIGEIGIGGHGLSPGAAARGSAELGLRAQGKRPRCTGRTPRRTGVAHSSASMSLRAILGVPRDSGLGIQRAGWILGWP